MTTSPEISPLGTSTKLTDEQATHISIRTSCRVCGNLSLVPVLSLGNQYVSNFVDTIDDGVAAPLELVLCNAEHGGCGLLQLKHTVAPEVMYRNYWYRSGVNQTMREALADITVKAERLVNLSSGDTVVDIGSNDGTLLQSYRVPGIKRVGFEPATNLLPYAAQVDATIINDFFSAQAWHAAGFATPAKIITSIAMFYDLEDPNGFVADIAHVLAPDGVWILQMSYLPSMLKQNAFDNICHEHLEYYSLLALENLLARHNLRAIDVELNAVNGGSYRVYITHAAPAPYTSAAGEKRLTTLRTQEAALLLHSVPAYAGFAERVNTLKQQTVNFIRQAVANGKTVYVYGASTKGNCLLQYYGLDHSLITAAAERNPDKWGKQTVGTGIPIVSEAEARAARPDYFLILPWHFLPEFVEREKDYFSQGGKFIVPLPEFQILPA